MFSHQDKFQTTIYVEIVLASGTVILVTPGHYIWATCSSSIRNPLFNTDAKIRAAQELQSGDYLWEYCKASRTLKRSKIAAINYTKATGRINPHTFSGTIIVDNVAALTFTESLPPSLAYHKATIMPIWIAYNIIRVPSFFASLNTVLLSYHPEEPFQYISALLHTTFSMMKCVKEL